MDTNLYYRVENLQLSSEHLDFVQVTMRRGLIVLIVLCILRKCVCDQYYDGDDRANRKNYYDNFENTKTTDYPPLKDFLEKYMNKLNNQKKEKQRIPSETDEGKTKSWDLLHVSQYNHPYDDKKGWVTLDAVPWSISKVSKWESNHKPNNTHWDQVYSDNKQDYWLTKPNKPSYDYDKPNRPDPRPGNINNYENNRPWNQKPAYHKDHDGNEPCQTNSDIITDGLPANFPKGYEKITRRHSTSENYPATRPSTEDGEWVLLSTTKGYKYPRHKPRSLQITGADTVSTHRSVRLTVLPPLDDSKINMTTSHGGLLEVESTFQSVDQAQKDFVRKERFKQLQQTRMPSKNRYKQIQNVISTLQRPNKLDSTAVVAAVGAGMIPATMAMLVPMAMSGRKKRNVNNFRYKENKISIDSTIHKFI